MKVLTHSTPVALWQKIVHEAEAACEITLQHELEAYLVFLLSRYINKPEIAKLAMATELMQALQSSRTSRDIALQGVGDTCLLFSGLFPGMASKRLVKISYFVSLGRGAYCAISKKSNDLYDLLFQEFVSIMDVLQSIRQHTVHHPDLMPLEAYDLWNDAGSKRALKVLKQYSNATPVSVALHDNSTCIIKIK
jgi:hypothetical protein